MKHPKPRAVAGGTLRVQLDAIINNLPPAPEIPKRHLTRRLQCAIEAVRRYICGEAGVRAITVTDKHVAKVALKLDWVFCYHHDFYIGGDTLNCLQAWADDVLTGRPVGKPNR